MESLCIGNRIDQQKASAYARNPIKAFEQREPKLELAFDGSLPVVCNVTSCYAVKHDVQVANYNNNRVTEQAACILYSFANRCRTDLFAYRMRINELGIPINALQKLQYDQIIREIVKKIS